MKVSAMTTWQMVLHSVLFSDLLNAMDFKRFMKHQAVGCRLVHQYRAEESCSLQRCILLCMDESSCKAINYRKDSGTCELNAKGSLYDDYESVQESGWEVYNLFSGTHVQHKNGP